MRYLPLFYLWIKYTNNERMNDTRKEMNDTKKNKKIQQQLQHQPTKIITVVIRPP